MDELSKVGGLRARWKRPNTQGSDQPFLNPPPHGNQEIKLIAGKRAVGPKHCKDVQILSCQKKNNVKEYEIAPLLCW